MKQFLYFLVCVFFLTGCQSSSTPRLKVAATSVPHAEILELIKPSLKEQNIELEILIIDDFNTPNRALADKEVDANFFQHLPFLEAQKADFGYSIESLIGVHLEPMALYSKKRDLLKNVKQHATIALPSDPSNQARALELLAHIGWITLKSKGTHTSLWDIATNPYQLNFIEMDSPLLSRALEDVDAAVISTNFALLGGLSPKWDALAVEDAQSRFVNVVAIRQGESQRLEIQALKRALTEEKVRTFIGNRYQGAILPAF